ncbi:hypothetical protein MKX01_036333 [Papaver californicum]|nr:hypothetical protein MKX01_036333 [Papaver californicum]
MVFQILLMFDYPFDCWNNTSLPKVLSLAHAFFEGNVEIQEEMLKWQGCKLFNGPVGRNIFQNLILKPATAMLCIMTGFAKKSSQTL